VSFLRKAIGAACVLVAILLALAATSVAAPVSLVVNTLTPEVESGSGGTSKLSLTFTNVSDEVFVLAPKAIAQPNCELTLSKNQLPSGVTTPVDVEIQPSCDADDRLKVQIESASKAGPGQTFEIDPKGAAVEDPDWESLLAFPIALAVSLLLALVIALRYWEPGPGAKRSLTQPLEHLDSTWKFNDNWVTNVSAVGALLTGLFSASTAKSFLGDDAEAQVALATVGAAIALAFVAAAPVVLLALKSLKAEKNKKGAVIGRRDSFTAGGLALAAALVLASAAGQLWVVLQVALHTEIGTPAEAFAIVAAGLAGLLLLIYTVRSLRDLLARGTEKPKEPKAVEIRAAETIARAIRANRVVEKGAPPKKVAEVERALEEASLYEAPEESRSALI
jgi:hypothetical protein